MCHWKLATPTAPTSKSCRGSMITPAMPCPSPFTAASTHPSSSKRSNRPAPSTVSRHQCSLTTACISPPDSPAAASQDQTISNASSPTWASPRNTQDRIIQRLAAKLNASNKPSKSGSANNPAPTAERSCKPKSTNSSPSTTTNDHTDPWPAPHPPSPTTASPKPDPPPRTAPYIVSAKTASNPSGKITIRHNSTLYKIGIGRGHKHQPVIALIDNLDIRIIHRDTGELLRDFTLDTTRKYQPQKQDNT